MEKRHGLGRLAPTPRLLLFIVLSTLFTLSSDWIPVLLSLAIAAALLIVGRTFPRPALVACFSAFVLTFAGHAVTAEVPTVSIFIFDISRASLLKGVRLGLRLAAMILPAIAFIAVTPLHELLQAFRGLRIPAAADMYLTIVLRYVDILWYDIQTSMKAMAVRGVNWEGSIGQKIPAFRRLMLPLIFRILDHVDGQSLAIDNRGGIRAVAEAPDVAADVPAVSMDSVSVLYSTDSVVEEDHAVNDLTMDLPQGGATVLLGRLGAGKTTTLLLCTGLIPKSVGRMKGDVRLFGHDTKESRLGTLGRLARIVFPSAVQGLVGLTVRDELAFSLRSSRLDDDAEQQAMVEALDLVGLDATFLDRLTLGLSGGEMQRVALASAIVARPYLLALDDVTVQLDPVGKREVVAALQSLLGGRVTTVMTDPHVELLAEVGTRFVSLQEGRVDGVADDLDAASLEAASLRVPQMLRLERALETSLPLDVQEALPHLATQVPQEAPRFAEAFNNERSAIVSAEGLTFTYPNGPTALHEVDVAFGRGEFVSVLGSNGSGKTTLALLLAGALEPGAGTVAIGDEPFDQARHRGIVGYVFQEPVNQMVTMKVGDELAFGPQQLGWEAPAVQEAVEREMERFALDSDAVPLHLPPADARKLAIAATLTMNPRLIILDEPTNNLDEDEVHYLMRHLKALQADETTVVVITHDVEVACTYADRVMVMSQGQILLDGPTRHVMKQVDTLRQSDVVVPPVVSLSLALWPDALPALTVDEMDAALQQPVYS
jgi:energy-coupling factor transport system ATP-binding protein